MFGSSPGLFATPPPSHVHPPPVNMSTGSSPRRGSPSPLPNVGASSVSQRGSSAVRLDHDLASYHHNPSVPPNFPYQNTSSGHNNPYPLSAPVIDQSFVTGDGISPHLQFKGIPASYAYRPNGPFPLSIHQVLAAPAQHPGHQEITGHSSPSAAFAQSLHASEQHSIGQFHSRADGKRSLPPDLPSPGLNPTGWRRMQINSPNQTFPNPYNIGDAHLLDVNLGHAPNDAAHWPLYQDDWGLGHLDHVITPHSASPGPNSRPGPHVATQLQHPEVFGNTPVHAGHVTNAGPPSLRMNCRWGSCTEFVGEARTIKEVSDALVQHFRQKHNYTGCRSPGLCWWSECLRANKIFRDPFKHFCDAHAVRPMPRTTCLWKKPDGQYCQQRHASMLDLRTHFESTHRVHVSVVCQWFGCDHAPKAKQTRMVVSPSQVVSHVFKAHCDDVLACSACGDFIRAANMPTHLKTCVQQSPVIPTNGPRVAVPVAGQHHASSPPNASASTATNLQRPHGPTANARAAVTNPAPVAEQGHGPLSEHRPSSIPVHCRWGNCGRFIKEVCSVDEGIVALKNHFHAYHNIEQFHLAGKCLWSGCAASNKMFVSLSQHVYQVHGKEAGPGTTCLWKKRNGEYCQQTHPSMAELQKHWSLKHKNNASDVCKWWNCEAKPKPKEGKPGVLPYQLEQHFLRVHGKGPESCAGCGATMKAMSIPRHEKDCQAASGLSVSQRIMAKAKTCKPSDGLPIICKWNDGCNNGTILGLAKDTTAATEILRKHFVEQHSRRLKRPKCLWRGCRRDGADFAANTQVMIHYKSVHGSETALPPTTCLWAQDDKYCLAEHETMAKLLLHCRKEHSLFQTSNKDERQCHWHGCSTATVMLPQHVETTHCSYYKCECGLWIKSSATSRNLERHQNQCPQHAAALAAVASSSRPS